MRSLFSRFPDFIINSAFGWLSVHFVLLVISKCMIVNIRRFLIIRIRQKVDSMAIFLSEIFRYVDILSSLVLSMGIVNSYTAVINGDFGIAFSHSSDNLSSGA